MFLARKAELVRYLNELLDMDLSVWQFDRIRRYELEEMVRKIYRMRMQIEDYRELIREERAPKQLEIEFDKGSALGYNQEGKHGDRQAEGKGAVDSPLRGSKGRRYNKGVDPAQIEAEVREAVEAVKEELKGDRS